MKNPYIIPAAMICTAILAGFWILKPSSEPQKVVVVQPPKVLPPFISMWKATRDGNIEAVRQHLDAGADVNAKDEDGWTPLHWAAWEGHRQITELLIVSDADVNAKDEIGMTPLHWAAVLGRKNEIVELLITNGADVNAKNDVGQTPLDWDNFYPEIPALLRKHGGKTAEELKAAGN